MTHTFPWPLPFMPSINFPDRQRAVIRMHGHYVWIWPRGNPPSSWRVNCSERHTHVLCDTLLDVYALLCELEQRLAAGVT